MINHPNDRRGEMPINPREAARLRSDDVITHGVIHHTGVWGKTADQHANFHTAPEEYKNGKPLGRNWPTVAYTSYVGLDGRRELLLDYFTVGYHCKGINTKSIGIVVEGNYDEKELPEKLIKAIVEECLWHETQLGRRLIWTWHNVVRPGWICPGKFFPKEEILARIEEEYIEIDEDPDIVEPPIIPPVVVKPGQPPGPEDKTVDMGCLAVVVLITMIFAAAISSL